MPRLSLTDVQWTKVAFCLGKPSDPPRRVGPIPTSGAIDLSARAVRHEHWKGYRGGGA
jgi:hypothetical protein